MAVKFVITGRTEEEANASREKEKANESDSLKEARRRHRRLVNRKFKREVKEIFSDPLYMSDC